MSKVDDLQLLKDFLALFDTTLNADARTHLQQILSTPLDSVEAIVERQHILQGIINSGLCSVYSYQKTDYSEVFYFLNLLDNQYFKETDYLTSLFQRRNNNRLIGHYIQLAYFFTEIEKILQACITIKKFPETYQQDLRFIFNYIGAFQLRKYKKQLAKGTLNHAAIQFMNKLVLEKRKRGDTTHFYSLLNRLEAYIAVAAGIKKMNFVFPHFGIKGFEIQGAYHPLLSNPVKNDINIQSGMLLLTGANMSGKSTFLKSFGIIVYLAHLGMAVPAGYASLPFYEYITVHINHSDDIKNGLSHFMQEIVNMKEVLQKMKEGRKCFAIFDELYKGTNYEDALQISKWTLEGLRRQEGSFFLISTHLYALKDSFDHAEGISAFHLDCKVEDNIPQFTYKLREGWTNLKIGELLFKREGLSELLQTN